MFPRGMANNSAAFRVHLLIRSYRECTNEYCTFVLRHHSHTHLSEDSSSRDPNPEQQERAILAVQIREPIHVLSRIEADHRSKIRLHMETPPEKSQFPHTVLRDQLGEQHFRSETKFQVHCSYTPQGGLVFSIWRPRRLYPIEWLGNPMEAIREGGQVMKHRQGNLRPTQDRHPGGILSDLSAQEGLEPRARSHQTAGSLYAGKIPG